MSLRDDELDEEFPLGDGTAETDATDCQVCCRPWRVTVHYLPSGSAEVSVAAEDPD